MEVSDSREGFWGMLSLEMRKIEATATTDGCGPADGLVDAGMTHTKIYSPGGGDTQEGAGIHFL